MTTVTELMREHPEATAEEIACMLIGNCAGCGATYSWPRNGTSPDEWLRRRIEQDSIPDNNYLKFICLSMQWRCESCIEKSERAREARFASTIADEARRMSAATFTHLFDTFAASSVMIEQRSADAWNAARSWSCDSCVWIHGEKAVGKTFMGHCLCNEGISHGLTAGKLKAIDMCASAQLFDWQAPMNKFASCGVLLIDDADKGDWNQKSINALWWMMDRRWDAGKPTVFTANFKIEAFRSMLISKCVENATIIPSLFDRFAIRHNGVKCIELTGNGVSLRRERSDYDDSEEE